MSKRKSNRNQPSKIDNRARLRAIQESTDGGFTIRPGQYLVVDISAGSGGVTYDRAKSDRRERGEGYEQEINSRKVVDHEAIIAESDALVQAARYVLRCNATHTPLGWIADELGIKAIREGFTTAQVERYPGFDELQVRAAELNLRASQAGSARTVRIGYVPVKLEIDNEAAAREIARTVREVCEELIRTCRAGDVDGIARVLLRGKNLERLATGMQRESILFAVECAKEARSSLRAAIKGQPEAAHERLLTECGTALDLEAIEACVGLFVDRDAADSAGGFNFVAEVA